MNIYLTLSVDGDRTWYFANLAYYTEAAIAASTSQWPLQVAGCGALPAGGFPDHIGEFWEYLLAKNKAAGGRSPLLAVPHES